MVNQIADFFDAYPESEAIAGVAEHLGKFWDPAMRRQLLDARVTLDDRLHPVARRALAALAETAS